MQQKPFVKMNKVGPTPAALVPLWKPGDSNTVNPHPAVQATLAIAPPSPTSAVPKRLQFGEMGDMNGTHTVIEVITKIVYEGYNASTLSTAPLPSSIDSQNSISSTSLPDQNAISTVTSTHYYTSFLPSASPLPSLSTATASQTATIIAQPTATVPQINVQQDNAYTHTGGLAHPNPDQIKTIWVAAVMLFSLLIGWNMILLRDALYPWKMWGELKDFVSFSRTSNQQVGEVVIEERLSYEFGECVF